MSVLGLARAFAYEPALASSWQSGASTQVIIPNVEWKNKNHIRASQYGGYQVTVRANGKGA